MVINDLSDSEFKINNIKIISVGRAGEKYINKVRD